MIKFLQWRELAVSTFIRIIWDQLIPIQIDIKSLLREEALIYSEKRSADPVLGIAQGQRFY